MDYDTRRELEKLKGDKKNIEYAIEADKISIKNALLGEEGKRMKEELAHPPKPNFWVGLRNRIRRWRTIKNGENMAKKEKGDN